MRAPWLASTPRGDGRPVIALPGLGTDDASMAPLRWFLGTRGYEVRGWGLGTNTGDVERSLERMMAVVDRTVERAEGPVALIGWSLGGVVAREVARDRPADISRVITFGTPLHGPRRSVAARYYGQGQIEHIEALIDERNRRPIHRPITAIHSRRDGIVDWKDCIDEHSPEVENVEVRSSHFGMGLDPDVWTIAARRLAEERRGTD